MLIALDYETYSIVKGSPIPPMPVGLAVLIEGEQACYYAWGHNLHNNCEKSDVDRLLSELSDDEIIMHNAKFDRSVTEHWFPGRTFKTIHDTMIMAYLNNPRDESFGLKQLSEKYLNRAPDEQLELKRWIISNVKQATEKTWGEFIAYAPGDLVGKYACADVEMTMALYNYYKDVINENKRPII